MPTKPENCVARHKRLGFTLTELIVAIVIVSLFVLLVVLNLSRLLRKNTFKAQVQEFISIMEMAANAASESDKRYEVIIDLPQQDYILREITSPDLSQVLEEEIIAKNNFSDNCHLLYVMFDDGDYTTEDRAVFRAGHSGWQYGGKIGLADENGNEYSIVVNRLNKTVELKQGDVEIMMPKNRDEVPF